MADDRHTFCRDVSAAILLIWPKRSYLLAESFTFCGRNVHEIRDVSAKNCGRNGSWPKRPVTQFSAAIWAGVSVETSMGIINSGVSFTSTHNYLRHRII